MNIPQAWEWDESKRQANIEKHGIDFADLGPIFTHPVVQRVDDRQDYGETRIVLLGKIEESVLCIVYTWRDSVCQIISARRANNREQRKYYQSFSERMETDEGEN